MNPPVTEPLIMFETSWYDNLSMATESATWALRFEQRSLLSGHLNHVILGNIT